MRERTDYCFLPNSDGYRRVVDPGSLSGTHFFTNDMGGNMMMYINLIGSGDPGSLHPDPCLFSVCSPEIAATFSRKRLFGYTSLVWATVCITAPSFIVWLHHFFTLGAGANVNAFFGITTMIIAIPTGVKIFNWLFTMYQGRNRVPFCDAVDYRFYRHLLGGRYDWRAAGSTGRGLRSA